MTNKILRTEKLQHTRTSNTRLLVLQQWEGKFIVGFSGFGNYYEFDTEEQALLTYKAHINDTHNWSVVA